MIMALYYDIIINKLKNFIILLQFIEIVIYFSKLIDFCINRQENPKVVNNYFVGTTRFINAFRVFDKSIFLFKNTISIQFVYKNI